MTSVVIWCYIPHGTKLTRCAIHMLKINFLLVLLFRISPFSDDLFTSRVLVLSPAYKYQFQFFMQVLSTCQKSAARCTFVTAGVLNNGAWQIGRRKVKPVLLEKA